MDALDIRDLTPLYHQIKEMLRKKIESGQYKPNSKIPSENELAEQLGVSKPTVRRAIAELVNAGYLVRFRGRGTFVTQTRIDQGFMGNLEGYSEEMTRRGLQLTSKVLEKKIIKAGEKIAAKLKIDFNDEVVMLCRLRFIEQEPILITTSYLPHVKVPGLLQNDFESTSLYHILESKYKHVIVKGVRTLEARLAGSEEARLLNIKKNGPIQYVESITYTNSGDPIEYIEAIIRGDRSRFTVELVRNRPVG